MSMYHIEDKLRRNTWAVKLFENTQEYVYDWRGNWSKHPHIQNKYLVLAVLDKNKEIEGKRELNKQTFGTPRSYLQAHAFRELVKKCEEMKQ